MSADPSHPGSSSGPHSSGELPKQYRPADHEPRIREQWESSRAFHPNPDSVLSKKTRPYAIFIPPPNVTDRLHLGHALNNSLQDILARAHRMMGFETLWMPGTDHAGIATQAVVEKRLRKDGQLKGPLREPDRNGGWTRERFVEAVQSFKDEYEATITGQLKAMGCSCDWERQRFTMDEQCAKAVYEAFFRLFRDGLIYRGKRLVNWDPVLQTAVADDECYEEEIDAEFFYLRYPLVHPHGSTTLRERRRQRPAPSDAVPVTWSELRARGWPAQEDAEHADEMPAWITVATTRPETYLGDTAVAVNPRDPRAKALRGLCVELPLIGRVVPILEDDYVVLPAAMQEDPDEAANDPKARYATGFLKVTPAHDPNDYDLGQRHKAAIEAAGHAVCINIFAPDATISDKHGWSASHEVAGAHMLVGLKREDARKKVIAEFKAHTVSGDPAAPTLFARSVPYRHTVKHSDRSKAIIEPYLSDQWYVKVTDDRLRGSALRAMAPEQRSTAPAASPAPGSGGTAGDGDLRFHPSRYAKTFESWHENIRDWCISRQLWWGHQIPVWSRVCPTRADALATRDDLSTFLRRQDWTDGVDFCIRAISLESGDDVPWPTFHDEFEQWHQATPEPLGVFACFPRPLQYSGVMIRLQQPGPHWFGLSRDPDVLDTWFSSGLWPLSTLGWPDHTPLLDAFNPSSVLCTAREIITLWVSRMVMFNRYFLADGTPGRLPFRDVFIHALIMDGSGQKMSKSLGNGVDPLDIIASHGADAMRFVLCQMTTQTQDVRMPVVKDPATGRNTSPKFDLGRNFCNKLWNAARFALTFLDGTDSSAGDSRPPVAHADLSLADRWMLSRLSAATDAINAAIRDYQFSEYAQAIYDLLWRDFCDWYLEAIKPTVAQSRAQQAVLAHALETIVRLLHPIAPFVTEAIWERLKNVRTGAIEGIALGPSRVGGLLCTAGWPEVSAALRDESAEREFERVRALVTAIREVRAQHNVPPKRRIALHLPSAMEAQVRAHALLLSTLAGLSRIDAAAPPASAVAFTVEGAKAALSDLADAVDASAERARLEKAAADATRTIATLEGRLANPGYAQKAPPAMVQQTRDHLAKARAELSAATESLARLPA
ncbi:MAG: valine--tRNA ligase [Phycisphaerae bacterium]|nr:valine--tRNA ligase [Phycisphaerae bacterium]